MQGVQRGEPCHKELRQLLEVERARGEKKAKGIRGEANRREKSIEAHNTTSKRDLDKSWDGKCHKLHLDLYPQKLGLFQ